MDSLNIGGKIFKNRMILGSGKYSSDIIFGDCVRASEVEMITVALRRISFDSQSDIINAVDKDNIHFIPNTSGAKDHKQAVRIAKVCRESGLSDWIKVEITPDCKYLMPDGIETFKACEILVKEGFTVLPYINADPVLAKKLEDIGCAAVMPLGSPIGTGKGLRLEDNIRIIIENSNIPVIIDAGIGRPSHAAYAMEIGASAVMLNTAVSSSHNPVNMAKAFSMAVKSGRLAYLSGIMNENNNAIASSELNGILEVI